MLSEDAGARLDTVVRGRMEHARTPGLALALTDRQGLIGARHYGLADRLSSSPVRGETLFEIGSIGKSFTSVLVQQLRAEGRVDLDAPVAEYLPWFEVRSEFDPITVRHLLTHTAGIVVGSDITSDSRWDVWALRDTPAGSPPGERFRYSNVGYRALGFLVEDVLGGRYPDIVRSRILEPLGMAASEPAITNDMRARMATPHQDAADDRPPDPGVPLVPATWLETDTGDGSLACTAEDLATFARMLLNRGRGPTGPILSEEVFDDAVRPRFETGEGWEYGMGVGTFHRDGHDLIGHGGSMVGFGSTMWADPAEGVGVTVLINGPDEGGFTEDVAAFALALARAERHGAPLPEVPPQPDRLAVGDPALFTGPYRGTDRGFVVTGQDGRLVLQWGNDRIPLESAGEDRFRAGHDDLSRFLLTFERDEGGPATRVWHGGTEYVRGDVPPTPVDASPDVGRVPRALPELQPMAHQLPGGPSARPAGADRGARVGAAPDGIGRRSIPRRAGRAGGGTPSVRHDRWRRPPAGDPVRVPVLPRVDPVGRARARYRPPATAGRMETVSPSLISASRDPRYRTSSLFT